MNLLTTIYVLDVVILLNRTPIIEWYVITCGFKANTYICAKRDWTTCSIVVPIIELILNIIGGKGAGRYGHLMSIIILTLFMNQIFS